MDDMIKKAKRWAVVAELEYHFLTKNDQIQNTRLKQYYSSFFHSDTPLDFIFQSKLLKYCEQLPTKTIFEQINQSRYRILTIQPITIHQKPKIGNSDAVHIDLQCVPHSEGV